MNGKQLNFTKATLESLVPSDTQYEVADIKIPGLRLRINPGNSRTFILLKKVNNRSQRIKIGRYHELSVEQARTKALKLITAIADGSDPQGDKLKSRAIPTFREMYETYYQLHASMFNKSPEHNRKIIDFHIMPVFGNTKIDLITKDKMRRLHFDIGEKRGKATANRVITVVQATFNFYIREGFWNGANPCFGLKKFPEYSRDRFLSHEEIKLFFNALEKEDQLFQDFLKLALWTGVRKSNLLAMKFEDIDFTLKRWRIAEHETKNKDVNIVMLSNASLEILTRRKMDLGQGYVFRGDGKNGHLEDPKRSFHRVKKRMGILDLRIHDLRRTLGSYMAINGASLPVIGHALNHKSLTSTKIYARLNQSTVLDAVENASISIIKSLSPNE